MSLASAAGAILKPQTPLQQLLEDINFQRTKEMRQLLKDDSGFVVLTGTTYWTELFVRHFLFPSEPVHSIDSDDLLFFVRKKHVKSSSRHMPKYETEVDVFRKDSRKLPIGDPDVDWEETVYLNMVIHQFDYTLTLAICTRTSPKELQVLRRHSQRVYASPSRRKMDTKGEGEEITYPHICFMVDNFDEVFSDILVRDGEMVCVELVANDKDGAVQGVIFLGSIRYDALKKVYDARQSSLSSKVAQRMSFGLFSSGAGVQTRCEFVRMKGPQGKGHAEMAVTKPKGSGVETPTSEPGFCATDMWDEWEEENDDYCTYRHQRRLSDPSANLNNFNRYGWRTKNTQDVTGAGAKARSENEGLDTLASEVSEIEAGDLRDDLHPAFSASEAKLHLNPNCEKHNATLLQNPSTEDGAAIASTPVADAVEVTVITSPTSNNTTGCGNCFGGKKCKRWVTNDLDKNTPEMSEIYCPTCDDVANETPACLNKMPDKKTKPKHKTILSVESELVVTKRGGSLRLHDKKTSITRSSSLSSADRKAKKNESSTNKKEKTKVKEKDKDKEKDKENTKSKETHKQKDKENKEKPKEKSSKTANILARVSPKRLRPKMSASTTESNTKTKTNKTTKETANNNVEANSNGEDIKLQEYEIADDATSLNGCEIIASENGAKMAMFSENDSKLMINVRGREELPVMEEPSPPTTADINAATTTTNDTQNKTLIFEKCVPVNTECPPFQLPLKTVTDNVNIDNKTQNREENSDAETQQPTEFTPMLNDCNGNCEATISPTQVEQSNNTHESDDFEHVTQQSTLPRPKRTAAQQAFYNKAMNLVPKRRTPDGTNIYYWCDFPRKTFKELDDGAYNPLWASRGFTQSFHFWKENRRQQSTPLNAFLTYVTLPWWSIAKDLLDHRETPILTF
ncbi:uncharacterized protein LOC119680388 isoform X1 [Teleopsis dalmanni]|uniref:uncharacterized protein LOC119680388 isoform X1 n=1 Tax=Teleopsis dalmanni TaxID=139649 RepID=UPI0018CDBC1E|nr:uncharacterized protein LOC119680388 isoform X1 [Teleopsis dalmanni]